MTDNYLLIMKNINDHKNDNFYSSIFNIMTDNDKVKNYSSNTNGIFFDFNKLSKNIIDKVVQFINEYNRRNEEKIKYEHERTEMITKQTKMYKDTMTKLSKQIQQSILHTHLEEEMNIDEDYTDNVEDDNIIDYKELFGESDEEI